MKLLLTNGRVRWLMTVCVMLILCLASGCAFSSPPSPYASKNFKAGKMAILPFDNLSVAPGAAKTMENFILVEFLKIEAFTIFEPGAVGEAISEQRVRLATNIPQEIVLKIGKSLGADLIMIGVVHDFQMQRLSGAGGSGETPALAMSVRILDAKTGSIVWATNVSRNGNDSETVFGIGKIQSLNRLATDTAADIAQACRASLK